MLSFDPGASRTVRKVYHQKRIRCTGLRTSFLQVRYRFILSVDFPLLQLPNSVARFVTVYQFGTDLAKPNTIGDGSPLIRRHISIKARATRSSCVYMRGYANIYGAPGVIGFRSQCRPSASRIGATEIDTLS